MSVSLFLITTVAVMISIGFLEAAEHAVFKEETRSEQFHMRRHVLTKK